MYKEWYKKGKPLLEEIKNTIPKEDEFVYWYIGQCGFVYKKDVIVYIDPVLNDLTDEMGETRRYYPAPFAPEMVEADYILCTHGHDDHLALETLVRIANANEKTRFIVPGACIMKMKEAGISRERIIEAQAGKVMELPGLAVHPISAAHPVHEKTEEGADVALCYELVMGNVRMLHMGDTYLSDQLLKDLQVMQTPDLFFPPINGSDYFRTARNCIGNLNMMESANLAIMLKADVTIPTHHDMVMGNTVDPLDFIRELRKLDTAAKWQLPALGERVVYRK